MKFNKIDKLILMGGSFLLSEFIKHRPKNLDFELVIFSTKRYLDELLPNVSLQTILKKHRLSYFRTDDINHDKNLNREVTKNSLGIAMGAWEFNKGTVKRFSKNHLVDFMSIDLPRYKGGAHHTWRVLHQNRKGCVNIQIIQGGADTFQKGPIIKRTEFNFPPDLIKPIDLYNYSLKQEVKFLASFLQEVKQGKSFKLTKLNEAESSYYPFLYTKEHGLIDWRWSAQDISLFINAFDDPYPGASTYLDKRQVFLKDCQMLQAQEKYHPFTAGIVVRKSKTAVFVASQDGLLQINQVLNEKGKNIVKSIQLGDRLYTPQAQLDQAMIFKAVYDSQGLKK